MKTAVKAAPTPVKKRPPALFWPVVGLATLTGMRSASAPALLSHFLVRHPAQGLASSPLRLFQQPLVATATKLNAALEFYLDKQPNTPDRTSPKGLLSRAVTGALVGAAWYKANRGSALGGAVVGSLGAVASTYLTLLLRKGISQQTHTSIALVGVGEDALVWSTGVALLHSLTPPLPLASQG